MELVTVTIFTFIWSPRPKFYYFLAVLSIDKMYVSFLKLAYAMPRPYMIDADISPKGLSCSKAFGNPSGHASAS